MSEQSLVRRLLARVFGETTGGAFSETEDFAACPRGTSGHPDGLDGNSGYMASLRAWYENPLARRIVSLTTQYVVGRGVAFQVSDPETERFLRSFWNHPLNQLDRRVADWSDELARSGNLFLRLTTDAGGQTYIRAVPASAIVRIDTLPNDAETAVAYEIRAGSGAFDGPVGYRTERVAAADRTLPTAADAIYHVAVNRPVGTVWGSSDLVPVIKWIRRYSGWLEDRARLNRYRNSFLFVVKSRLASEVQRTLRQKALNAQPPSPGSILVTTEQEDWSVLSPRLESHEAGEDGIALKKMIAVGAGVPLHFLAEPESENKASAEASGGSAYRGYEQRQQFFLDQLRELLAHVVSRAALANRRVDPDAEIRMIGADINASDNLRASQAGWNAVRTMQALRAETRVDEDEFRRIVYRFLGES